jgi:hypothetical protein
MEFRDRREDIFVVMVTARYRRQYSWDIPPDSRATEAAMTTEK